MYNESTLIPQTCGSVGFEGPEKRLEIDFKMNPSCPLGLRSYTRDQWQEMLNFAKCTIISQTSNEHFDSYVLSESSLFIYPLKMIVKTCGTTTLLHCIPKLMEYANHLNLALDLVRYSRKNFLFPEEQIAPHHNWDEEVAFLNSKFDGTSYVYGPLTEEHWYLYLADYSSPEEVESSSSDVTLEILMHGMAPEAGKRFYRAPGVGDKDPFPGIADLLPGSKTDEFNFEPCGYSMNGLRDDNHWTIHVTPEPHCSYASFETNAKVRSYPKLLSRVCRIFQPNRFLVALFSDRCRVAGEREVELSLPGYSLTHKTVSELDLRRIVTVATFELDPILLD